MAEAITPLTKVVFISNPNNPTGTMVTAGEVEAFLKKVPPGVLVVFDEAYREYVDRDDFPESLSLLRENDQVLVMRTFSKAYGLAGLRIGYGFADRKIIESLNKVRQPFNINFMAQVAALAALQDQEHVSRVTDICRKEKKRMAEALSRLGLDLVPSETNFILFRVGGDGRGVYKALLKRGVIVRVMHAYGFPDYLRVTVGLPDENDRFVTELASVLELKPTE
jgi:histidinol-phosphate aminotransferase